MLQHNINVYYASYRQVNSVFVFALFDHVY